MHPSRHECKLQYLAYLSGQDRWTDIVADASDRLKGHLVERLEERPDLQTSTRALPARRESRRSVIKISYLSD